MTKSRLTVCISFFDSKILAAIIQPLPIFGGRGELKTMDKEMGEDYFIAAKSNNYK